MTSNRSRAGPPTRAGLAALAFATLITLSACGSEQPLRPFASDGCSLFPDRAVIGSSDWCQCCLEHDMAYWRGGTAAARKLADVRLRDCVAATTGNRTLAAMMYRGVRVGGSPYFYTWYRWGYGWSYGRNYEALTAEEERQADALLARYREAGDDQVCVVPP